MKSKSIMWKRICAIINKKKCLNEAWLLKKKNNIKAQNNLRNKTLKINFIENIAIGWILGLGGSETNVIYFHVEIKALNYFVKPKKHQIVLTSLINRKLVFHRTGFLLIWWHHSY